MKIISKYNKRFVSGEQEKRVAKATGGKKQPNSGATLFQKGDVKIPDIGILIECKTKMGDSKNITIKKEYLEKLEQEAIGMGYNPKKAVLTLSFDNEKDYYLISDYLFTELCDILRKGAL